MRSMGMACSTHPCVSLHKSFHAARSSRKILMIQQSQVQVKRFVKQTQRIKSYSPMNKVFEDKSQGIICYRDDDGEFICEGYDEGPRFPAQSFSMDADNLTTSQFPDIKDLSSQKKP